MLLIVQGCIKLPSMNAIWLFNLPTPFILSLPILFCNSPVAPENDIGLLEIAGGALGIFGLIVVTIADQQKQTFKDSPENEGKWCDIGLFKYSRHPHSEYTCSNNGECHRCGFMQNVFV